MSKDRVESIVSEAMNPEEFDVLDYLDGAPVGTDEVVIYTRVGEAREMRKLLEQRREVIASRQNKNSDDFQSLAITEAAEDTEFDERINELQAILEDTAMTFKLKTVAPALAKAINKKARASIDKSWDEEKVTEHLAKYTADLLTRAIDTVIVGNGRVDTKKWTGKRLQELEDRLYPEQAEKLIGALYDMVHAGDVFNHSLTVDF